MSDGKASLLAKREAWPGANTLPWEEDPIARAVVQEFGALDCVQIAECLGISHQMVSRILHRGLTKLLKKMCVEQKEV